MKPMNGRLVKPNPMKPGMGKGPTNPGMPGPINVPRRTTAPGKSYDNDGPKRNQSPERFGMMQQPPTKKPMPKKPAPKAPTGQRMMGTPMPKKAALQKRLGR